MKTIISGRVTPAVLERAELIAGIVPTSFITNGESAAPGETGLWVEEYPICKMQPHETAELARDYTLCQQGEALIVVGSNPHLVGIAEKYGLPVYEER